MTTAGKILIMPKGDYDSSKTYEILDLVKHNGMSWLAKKDVPTGTEPSASNVEYWYDLFDMDQFLDAKIEAKVNECIQKVLP